MAINQLFNIFQNRLDKIEKMREYASQNYIHYYSFPLDKVTATIKSAFSATVLKSRITKKNNPFTKNSELEKAVDKELSNAFYKVYSEQNILEEFERYFPNGVSIAKDSRKTVPKIAFIKGAYDQKRKANTKRSRVIVTDNLLVEAVNELLELIPKHLDKEGSSKHKNYYKGFAKTRQGNVHDARSIQGIGIGLHGDLDDKTTVAILAFLDGVKRVAEGLNAPPGGFSGSAQTYLDEQKNKVNNIFGVRKGLKVSKHTLEDYFKNPKLIDTIEVSIEYGTNLHQSEQQSFDAKVLKFEMQAARDDAIEGLKAHSGLEDYVNLEASKPLKDRLIDGAPITVLEEATKSLKKSVIKKRLPKKNSRKTTSSSMSKKGGKKRTEKKVSKTVGRKGKVHYGRKGTQAGIHNPIALKELINQQLPSRILPKMQAPALVNRTGRFRHSAEVTNVVIGPRGGTQIDYTYQRNPYEVFEPGSGSPLANQYRDPRRIIGGTIREIAQQIMSKKFITVRRV